MVNESIDKEKLKKNLSKKEKKQKGRSQSLGTLEELMDDVAMSDYQNERSQTMQLDTVPFETNFDLQKHHEIQ